MNEIKFKFSCESIDETVINNIFNKITFILDFQLDENYKPYFKKNENPYALIDLSNKDPADIEDEINSFLNFSFDEIINVPLYKFLLLKTSNQLIVVSIIHSSIFNFTSFNIIFDLFNHINGYYIENTLSDDFLNYVDLEKNYFYLNNFPQNIFINEAKLKNVNAEYNIPFKIKLNKINSVEYIKNDLNNLFRFYPILSANINENLLFSFNGEPSIKVGKVEDIDSLIRPFELDDCLSRFLVVDEDDNYQLLGVFHHLVFDALTDPIFKHDLLRILNAESIEFDSSFLKVSGYCQEIESSEKFVEAKTFYDMMLADVEETSGLLDDVITDGPGNYSLDLDIDNTLFKDFLEKNNVSENVLFTSVFAYTLSRFTGNEKVLFNIIKSGRDRFNYLDAIGMFVNTLPVLFDCKDQDVSSFMNYSSDLIYGVMKHNYYPFRLLTKEYEINSNIIFQYISNWRGDNYRKDNGFIGVLNDLVCDVTKKDNKYELNFIHSDRYSSQTIESIAQTYNLILQEMINVEELSNINYITDSDIKQLDAFNHTEAPLDYEDILDAFNDNLLKCPDSKLVSFKDVSYTFAEGAFIADEIAKKLIELGVKNQDCVSFLVPRSELYIFCVLGIMSIGGIYVPLDDKLPDERIEFMMKDAQSRVLIVNDETYERALGLENEFIILNISDIFNDEIKSLDYLDISYGHLACILYTSGSTGLPKGVKIIRKSLVNFIDFHVTDLDILPGDVYGLYASIGFDVSMAAMFSVIYSGACLNVIPDEIKLNIDALSDHFIEYNITHSYITTQIAKLIIGQVEETPLKVLIAGGEKLGQIDELRNYRIVDAYGPTEACVYVISAATVDKIHYSSVGYVQTNTKAYILDSEFRRVPIGAVGELYLSGCQLADGYLNREEETSKAFLTNPFEDNEEYGRLYCTGDVARILPDGTYGIVGRRDGQVKIRGNRVELLEVEATIRDLDIVEDVTVKTIKNGSNNELVAYVVPSENIDEDNLRELVRDYVGENKPDYMVPAFVLKLDSIPLNVNGKVDKRALPKVDFDSLHAEYVAPRTETEKVIVESFEYVFNQKNIGINDDFVRLGGDSLTAIKLNSYLKEYNITVADLLSLRTPKAIAENISKESFDLDIYSLENGCPLNESQLNVYLDMIANNKFDSYNITLVVDIPQEYSADDVYNTLNKISDVHPILKMHLSDDFDVPYLVNGNKPPVIIESDVDNIFINEFLTKEFDLEDSLARFLIVDDDGAYNLFAVFHHIIFDALSDVVFKQDLFRILEGEFIELDDSFLKVSAFSQQIQNSEKFTEAKEFYDIMLADVEETSSLLDDVITDGPGHYSLDLDLDNELLKEFLDKNNLSENVLFTSVFAYTLSRFAGSEKVFFNIVENGRDRFNNLDAIGMFVNTLPVLFDCKNQEISSFMKYTFNLIYGVMKHNYYPFRLIANDYDINSNMIFQYIPNWIGNTNNQGGELIEDVLGITNDFVCDVTEKDNGYDLNFRYSDRYSLQTIKSFAKTYNLILQEMIHAEELSDISFITDYDADLLDSYNKTETSFEYDDILEAFNDKLEISEDKLLVGYEDSSFTYGQGAYIVNELANQLKYINVSKQDFVGLFVPRSEWFLLASMGVLSIGSIYVPIDVTYPDDRIQFMLSDTSAKVVIVNDETEERMLDIISENNLDIELLNVSRILDGDIGSLTNINIVESDDEDIACVLYTSGTTGVPKGVLVTRKAVNNFIFWYVEETEFTGDDIYGMHCSYVFDIHTAALYAPIVTGGGLYVVPENIRLDLKALNDYYVEHNCTHTYITSQVGKLFAESGMETTIKLICFGGMKLGELNAPDSIGPFESYGPSENLAISTSIFANKRIHSSSIGRFISNVKGYVLDSEHRRLPIGAVGELYLAGHQLTRGYLNREEENVKSFFENPFDDEEGYERIYSTGDMVRFLPDGTLGIVGRRDSQVKIRGNRVELLEVESVIRNMDIIEDVTVQTVKNNGNNELVAYVVLSDKDFSDDLRSNVCDYVNDHKPNYMVPSYVVELDEIPLNVNGKVDKHALPEVDMGSLSAEYLAPRNETEKIIIEIWEDILEYEPIGINDNFYHLGGDSIKAIRIMSKLNQKALSVQQKQLMLYPTPGQLAEHVQVMENDIVDGSKVSGFVDFAPIQNYFFNREWPDPHHYNQSILLEVDEIDVDWLRDAFNVITKQHPMLRTIYKDNSQYVQKYSPDKHFDLKEYGISDIEEIDAISNEAQSSFNLSDGPLIKLVLFHHVDMDYLLIVIHHLVIDGVSWRIILNDLETLSGDINANINEYTPYKNWVHELNESANTISNAEKSYWENIQNHILDSKTSNDDLIKTSKLILDSEITNDLIYNVNDKLNTNVRDILLSSFLQSMSEVFNRNDFVVSLEGHGREQINNVNLTETIGWFTSIYPVLFENITDNVRDNLINTKETIRKVPKNGLNYQLLYPSLNKLPELVFNYLGTFTNENSFKISNIAHGDEISSNNAQKELITVDAENTNDQIYCDIIFNNSLITDDEMELLKRHWIVNIKVTIDYLKDSDKICTPSDLGELSLEFSEFDKLLAKYGGNIESICGLNSLQERMVNYQKDRTNAYRIQEIIHVPKVLDEEIVSEALDILTQKYEILRSQIDFEFKPRLILLKNKKIDCYFHEFVDKKQLYDLSKKDFDRGFKLDEDSLFRLNFIKAEDSTYIIWSITHIITEGWSFYLLMNEFFNAYDAIENNSEYQIDPQIPLKYYLEELKNNNIIESLGFWNEHLKGFDSNTVVPQDLDGIEEFKVDSENIVLDLDLYNDIKLYCQSHEITLNSFMEAVWTKILSKLNRTNDIEYAKIVSGRNNIPSEFNTDSQIGMYLNIIPQRVISKDDYSFSDLAQNIQRQSFEAQRHDYVSLYEIEENVKGSLANTLFIFENYYLDSENKWESLQFYEEWQFPIVCEIELENSMNILIEYHANLFSKSQIQKLLKMFEENINDVI